MVSAPRDRCAAILLAMFAAGGLTTRAQMVPVPGENSAPTVNLSQPLYTDAVSTTPLTAFAKDDAPAATRTEEAGSSSSVAGPSGTLNGGAEPAPKNGGAANGVTRPPAARVKDLPAKRLGDQYHMRPLRAVAFGLTASTLGGGAEMALPLARTVNVRVGGSYIRYDVPFAIDGIHYDPGIKFVAGRSTIDWFPHHGAFHISAGALFFKNAIAGAANVAEGQTFTLAGTTYVNSVDDPIRGSASIVYHRKLAPMVLLGFGNILPRSGRHFSMPFEIGGAYLAPPDVNLNLAGTACTNQGCFDAARDSTLRENLASEQARFTSDLRYAQVYPIVSLGMACRF